MKEHIECITDSFTDYAGNVHQFVIAAVSQNLPTCTCELEDCEECDCADVTYTVAEFIDHEGVVDCLGTVKKVLKIGISMCNPIDTFDEKIGTLKAISRARTSDPVIYASDPGVINTKVVKALLEQEAQYLKNNPENFIPGYIDMRDRYLTNKEMESMKEDFSEIENKVVEGVQKDPKFLDRVLKYLNWLRKHTNSTNVKGN